MSTGRLTLAQQLKQLHNVAPEAEADPESAYSFLSSFKAGGAGPDGEGDVGRAHYATAGPSRIRDTAASTFDALNDKYATSKTNGNGKGKRVKIFDDDLSDEEEEVVRYGEDGFGTDGDEEDEEDEENEDLDDEEEEEEEEDYSGEGEEDESEGDGAEEDNGEEDFRSFKPSLSALPKPKNVASDPKAVKVLDPMSALKSAKAKDVEKGEGIRRQQRVFDELLTARINFQKAVVSAPRIPNRGVKRDLEIDEEVREKGLECLKSLGELSEGLFQLRDAIDFADVSKPNKRRKVDDESAYQGEGYWVQAASDNFSLIDDSHAQLLSILNKWSTKIQAATIQQQSMGKSGNKFSAVAEQVGVVEAIEAGLRSRAQEGKDVWQGEESGYKALLREVIESRSSAGVGIGASHMQSEKKKRRDAERGGSKGRKLRYTVHEQARNFVVPIPLPNMHHGNWTEERIDELFAGLFGGEGARALAVDAADTLDALGGDAEDNGEDVGLGGLRVF